MPVWLPASSRLPSGLNATAEDGPSRWGGPIGWPVAASQRRTSSFVAVATILPFGLNATVIEDDKIIFQGMVNRLTRVHIPKPCCPVIAASQNRFAVGTIGDSPDAALMTPELSQFSSRRCIPEAGGFVHASRQYGFSIWTEGHGHQNALMSQRRAEGVAGADLPEPDRLILRSP